MDACAEDTKHFFGMLHLIKATLITENIMLKDF